jgi:uncharacterized RDD family membrane protein YckC
MAQMTEREPSILKEGAGSGQAAPPPRAAQGAGQSRPVARVDGGAAESMGRRDREADRSGAAGAVVTVAGFWHRAAAALVDIALVLPVAWLVTWIAGSLAGMRLPPARRTGIDYWLDLALAGEPALWGGLALTLAVMVIYLLLFQAMSGRTLGMRLLRLRVIDVYGDPPSVLVSMLRSFGYLVCLGTLSLGFVWVGFDREKRGLHDWIAGTYVVRAPRGT